MSACLVLHLFSCTPLMPPFPPPCCAALMMSPFPQRERRSSKQISLSLFPPSVTVELVRCTNIGPPSTYKQQCFFVLLCPSVLLFVAAATHKHREVVRERQTQKQSDRPVHAGAQLNRSLVTQQFACLFCFVAAPRSGLTVKHFLDVGGMHCLSRNTPRLLCLRVFLTGF